MTMGWIWVGIGGFFGAMARYGVSEWVARRRTTSLPVATLFVNLLGALLLGVIVASNLQRSWALALGTGFMGAFTTFSTFTYELNQLASRGKRRVLFFYSAISIVAGIALAWVGTMIGRLLF